MSKHKLKNLIQKYIDIENNRCFKLMRPLIKDKNLWHFNRYSFAAGISIGIFCGWIPIPFHTVLAIFMAIVFNCNVPLAVISIWVANPLTMPEMYYFAYKLGAKILHVDTGAQKFDLNIDGFLHLLNDIWQPLIIGCILCGLITAMLVYATIYLLWAPLFSKHLISRPTKPKSKKKNTTVIK